MPDSETYIHPIIQAMVDSANLKSKAISQQNQSDQAKEEAKLRRDQLAETIKRAEDEHKINLSNLDLHRDEYNLQVRNAQHLMRHGILEDIKTGVRPIESLPSAPTIPTTLNSQPGAPDQTVTPSPASVQPAPNFSQMPPPGPSSIQDGNVDVGGQSMPRAAVAAIPDNTNRIAGQREAAIATARDSAATPNQDKKDADAYTRAIKVAEEGTKRAESVARINASANHDRGELALLARIIAMNGGMAVDPDVATSKYNSILDGQTGYQSLSKGEKAAVDKIAATRGTSLPTNQVAYSKKLDQMSGIQQLLDQARDVATNYSKDSPNQPDATTLDKTIKGAQSIPLLGRLINPAAIPGTDLKSKLDDMKSKGGALASFYDQQNRKSDAEILRQVTGLFDPKATTKQNLEKIETHTQNLRKTVKGDFAGINPHDVERILSERGSHDLLESMNPSGSKPLTDATMHQILIEAHGDPNAALQLAIQRGYDIPKGPAK